MPHNPQFYDSDSMPVDVRAALCSGGTFSVYGGTQPVAAGPLAGQPLLVQVALPTPAFGLSVADGLVATAPLLSAIPAVASASGWATWFRVASPDGTPVFDGTAGADSTFDLVLMSAGGSIPSAYIAEGVTVTLAGFSLTGNVPQDVVASGGVIVPPPAPPAPPVPVVPSGFGGTEPAFPGTPVAFEWCGYWWEPENWGTASGQPQASQVTVDASGYLNLSIGLVNGQLVGSEIDSVRGDMGIAGNPSTWGYGTYEWVVGTDLSSLDPALVLGLFTFSAYGSATSVPPNAYGKGGPPGQKEIDIEVSNWEAEGDKVPGTFFQLGFYQDTGAGVVSGVPVTYGQQCHTMTDGSQTLIEPGHAVTTVRFTWVPDYIEWNIWYSADTTAAPDLTLRMTDGEAYSYTQPYGGNLFSGTVTIPETGTQQVCMNLWTPNPAGITETTKVVIQSFSYTPSS